MSDKELYQELVKWFKKYEDSPDKWNKTYCGELIKRKLSEWGNFKNARRGNPRKGYNQMIDTIFKRNNPDYEEDER